MNGSKIKERRHHDHLREMVDDVCKGVMPHIAKRIKGAARRAYYLGVFDGIQIERERKREAS